MRWVLRAVVVVLVVFAASPAHARRGGGIVVINTGSEIIHVRDLPDEPGGEDLALGYKHELFGVFWLDLWRWDGAFVVYSGQNYAPLSDEELASLGGASVPWGYWLPPGLVLIFGVLEFAIITLSRRRVKHVLIIGGVLIAFAILLLVKGVDKTFAIPLALGIHHVVIAWLGMRAPAEETIEAAAEAAIAPPPPRRDEPREDLPPPPRAAAGPLAIVRPPTAPVASPVVHDPDAEAPKLLR